MGSLRSLPNIGTVVEQKLKEVGIDTPERLGEVGSREAFLRIRDRDRSACYNMLCGLEGAIQGVRWHVLPAEVKAELKEFYHSVT